MKRFLAAVLLLGPACLAPLVPACSKTTAADQEGDAGDAGVDQQSVPVVLPDGSSDAADDGGALGTGFPDADAAPSLVPLTCTTASDCTLVAGLTCGYSASGGCSVDAGYCIQYAPPENTTGTILEACGCNGQPVLYVNAGETPVPVASPNPCGSGLDAGADASDAGEDAGPTDASISDASPVLGCLGSGGTVGTAQCCTSSGSFPDTCSVGACSCAPSGSTTTAICECPLGTCFSAAQAKCVND